MLAELKKVPVWAWIAGGVGLLAVWLIGSRSAPPAPASSAPSSDSAPSAPTSSADQFGGALDSIGQALGNMADYMASATASLHADNRSTTSMLDRTEQDVATLTKSVNNLTHASETEGVHFWSADKGWGAEQFVTADNAYEKAIAAANDRYYNAKSDSERQAAHADAEAARTAAGSAGVKLDPWAMAGHN